MRVALIAGLGALLGGCAGARIASAGVREEERPNPCAGRGTSLIVLTEEGRMYLCERDKPIGHYAVSLGRRGTEKEKRGDLRTPLGTYALGTPRRSEKFGMFIPV